MTHFTTSKRSHTERPAFTLIELVFVIVVLGILAALAIPRLDRDIRQEAADNILSAIRYTRLMALTDDKSDPTDGTWQQTLWSIRFTGGSDAYYRIGSDIGKNAAIAKEESAIDPSTGKYFFNSGGIFSSKAADESPLVFLGHNYGINTIHFRGGCSDANKHIGFDHFGRPHTGIGTATNDYSTYINQDCTITFGFQTSGITDLKITIEKQTGRAYIVGQPGS